MEDKIFTLVKKFGNDSFSKMDKRTLYEIMKELDKYYLELRNHLSISNLTFGIEIELENSCKYQIRDEIIENNLIKWKVTRDGSLEVNGCEIVSPILTDSYESFNEMKTICDIAANNGEVGENCGGHIHIGTQLLGGRLDNWINFIGLWSTYENIFYRFLYGEFLTPRTNIEKYAKPQATVLYPKYLDMLEKFDKDTPMKYLLSKVRFSRNTAINFGHVDQDSLYYRKDSNTIEFRAANGSTNPVVWQNNVNLIAHILEYSTSKNFDRDILKKREKDINRYSLNKYNMINLDQAIEVCDLIFSRNIDKLYFLRQYLKSNETSNRTLIKAKKFTK